MADEEVEVEINLAGKLNYSGVVDPDSLKDLAKNILLQVTEEGNCPFAPWIVYTDKEYAKYVEFGTGPAKNADPKSYEDKHRKMEKWLENTPKYHTAAYCINPEEQLSKLIKYINKHGTPPRPYIRPAMRSMSSMSSDVTEQMNSDKPGSFVAPIAEELKNRIVKNLSDNLSSNGNPGNPDGLKGSFNAEEVPATDWQLSKDGYGIEITGESTEVDALWDDPTYKGVDNKMPKR